MSTPGKDYLKVYGPAVLVTVVGFVLAYQFVDPAPPDSLVIGTGGEDGAYYQFGQRYREILADEGISLEVRSTAGSVENIKLLETSSGGVDVAFVQGGTEAAATSEKLLSLGSLYLEPLWVFQRAAIAARRLPDLQGKRIAVGPEGSGTRAVALQLLADNGFTLPAPEIQFTGGQAAAEALIAGKLDAAFFIASADAPVVRGLLAAEGVSLMSFERAEAYARTHRFLSRVQLPEGAIDFERNIPAQDTVLLAPAANIVVRENFHPALVDLLLLAAAEAHGAGGLFAEPGEFPAPKLLAFPLSKEAKRHFKSGPPFLQRYLPFWAATLVARLKVMLVPLLALLFPLFKVLPPTYRWRVRSKILRWYKELVAVDMATRPPVVPDRLAHGTAELDRIEQEVAQLSVPLSYRDEVYNLRLHIDHVRKRLPQPDSP